MNLPSGLMTGIDILSKVLTVGAKVAPPTVEIIKTLKGARDQGRDLDAGEITRLEALAVEAEAGWAKKVQQAEEAN
ncbi:MAG: hypothetical protein R3E60_06890 [Alphaproteobacteria bacterium]